MRLRASWAEFLRGLRERGLRGARLVVGDQYLVLVEAAREALPEAKMQRRVARFYRNVSSKVPKSKVKAAANSGRRPSMLWMSKKAAREKAASATKELERMRLNAAAETVESGMEETLAYYDFPAERWRYMRANNVIERVNLRICAGDAM